MQLNETCQINIQQVFYQKDKFTHLGISLDVFIFMKY